jgi:hypothetical protein
MSEITRIIAPAEVADAATLSAYADAARAHTALVRAQADLIRAQRPVPSTMPLAAPQAHPGVDVRIPSAVETAPAGRRLYTGAEVAHAACIASTGVGAITAGALLAPGPWALVVPLVTALGALGSRIAMHAGEPHAVQLARVGHDRHGRIVAE